MMSMKGKMGGTTSSRQMRTRSSRTASASSTPSILRLSLTPKTMTPPPVLASATIPCAMRSGFESLTLSSRKVSSPPRTRVRSSECVVCGAGVVRYSWKERSEGGS
jgi:hypothetical protein